jgi:hypothetical protein
MKYVFRMVEIVRDRTPFLRHDSVRLTAAIAVVGGAFFGLYSTIERQPPALVIDEGAVAARFAESQREAAKALAARRSGSILFVSADKYCEEYRFDNSTGHVVSIDYVDCEERLARDDNAKKEVAKTANMKGMLASFKK